jgi:hypothetical protein
VPIKTASRTPDEWVAGFSDCIESADRIGFFDVLPPDVR